MAQLPPVKAPAGIYLKPGPGREAPEAARIRGAFMFGAFGDLAFVLAHLEPKGGDIISIESPAGILSHEEAKAEYRAGRIQRVN